VAEPRNLDDFTAVSRGISRAGLQNLENCGPYPLCRKWLEIQWSTYRKCHLRNQMGPPSLVTIFYQSRVLLVALSKSALLNFWDFIWTPKTRSLGAFFARLTRECRNISNLHVIQHTRNVATAQNYNSRKFGLKNVTGDTECNFFGESCFGESGRHPLNSKIADGYRK